MSTVHLNQSVKLIIILIMLSFANISFASPVYEIAMNPSAVVNGTAEGFQSEYGANAQARGDVLCLRQENGLIRVTDPKIMAAGAVGDRIVELSADLRIGEPARTVDNSLVVAAAFGGQTIDGAIWFSPISLTANGQRIIMPLHDWFSFRLLFDAAHHVYAIFLNGRLVVRAQTTATAADAPSVLWFGDGSVVCSGSAEVRNLKVALLENTEIPAEPPVDDQREFYASLAAELEALAAGNGSMPIVLPRIAPAFRYGDIFVGATCFDKCVRSAEHDSIRYQLQRTMEDGRLRYTLDVILYPEFHTVEWMPWLENVGTDDTAPIHDFRSLNYLWQVPDEYKVLLQRNLGSQAGHDDYLQADTVLQRRLQTHLEMVCTEGRSSADWLPFFGLKCDGCFFHHFGIGWSGAWKAEFNLDRGAITAQCGLRKTDFSLHPGEKVRQASFFMMEHDVTADTEEAQNLFRRFMLAHHSPRDSHGRLIEAPLSFSVGGGIPPKMLHGMLDFLQRERIPCEMLWMDAGWYGEDHRVWDNEEFANRSCGGMVNDTLGDWHSYRGDWRVNRMLHTDGLKPYAEKARAMGMGFLLWFELERVSPNAPLAKEHPEWLLRIPDAQDLVLNLGIPEAVDWTVEQLRDKIVNEGVTAIRIDFNINTLPFWDIADSINRTGITETKYIMGLYNLFDRIRAMCPDAAIDNCASGGRRNDFESLSRSIPLWRIDGPQTPESHQMYVSELSRWIPQHAAGLYGSPIPIGDDYTMLSLCSTATQFSYFTDQMEQDPQWLRDVSAKILSMRKLFLQNMYHLTDSVQDMQAIHALQCDSLDHGEGCVIAFRRLGKRDRAVFPLRHVDDNAVYDVQLEKRHLRLTGAQLRHLEFTFPRPRSVALVFYRKAQ